MHLALTTHPSSTLGCSQPDPDHVYKIYEEVKDSENLQLVVEEYLAEFNGESKQPMNLVMFGDAIEHVARISRVIRCEVRAAT